MRNSLTLILVVALGLFLAPACSPELDFVLESFQAPQAEISGTAVSPSLLFTSDEGQATVVFHCNRRWSAAFVNDRAAEWCSISGTEGRSGTVTIFVRVRANADYDERSASIVFTCDDVTRTLVVTQKQKDALFLNSNRVDMPCEGGTFTMTYRTNIASKVTIAADAAGWISAGKTKGLSTLSETFTVKPNETLESRQGSIEVTSALGREVLTVYQAGEQPTLVLGAHEVDIPAAGDGFSIQVTSNLDVSVSFQSGKWVREVSTKTISTNTFYFTVDRNESRSAREDVLVFRDKKRGVADSVRIRQAFQPILLETDPLSVPASASVRMSLLTAEGKPDDFKVTTKGAWLVLEEIAPDGDACRIWMATRPNKSSSTREGVIQVYHAGYSVPDEIVVTQAAAQPYFTYSTRKTEIHAPAFAQSGEGFILWGDGTFSCFDKFSSNEKDLVHVYADGKKSHSILVECGAILWLQVPEPEDAMYFDFSTLKKKE